MLSRMGLSLAVALEATPVIKQELSKMDSGGVVDRVAQEDVAVVPAAEFLPVHPHQMGGENGYPAIR